MNLAVALVITLVFLLVVVALFTVDRPRGITAGLICFNVLFIIDVSCWMKQCGETLKRSLLRAAVCVLLAEAGLVCLGAVFHESALLRSPFRWLGFVVASAFGALIWARAALSRKPQSLELLAAMAGAGWGIVAAVLWIVVVVLVVPGPPYSAVAKLVFGLLSCCFLIASAVMQPRVA